MESVTVTCDRSLLQESREKALIEVCGEFTNGKVNVSPAANVDHHAFRIRTGEIIAAGIGSILPVIAHMTAFLSAKLYQHLGPRDRYHLPHHRIGPVMVIRGMYGRLLQYAVLSGDGVP